MRFALLVFFAAATGFAAPKAELSYEVRLDGRELIVDLRFDLPAAGAHQIVLPNMYGGMEELWKGITEPEVVEAGLKLEPGERPFLRVMRTGRPTPVHLRYRVRSFEGPVTYGQRLRPIIQPDYMQLVGNVWIVRPNWPDLQKRRIVFEWKLPPSWGIGNSFGQGKSTQEIDACLRDVQQGLYVAGDFRFHRTKVRGQPVVIAFHGRFGSTDDEFASLASRVISAQRELWRDDDFPFYFLSILAIDISMGSTSGIGRANGFAVFLAPGRKIDDAIFHVLSHELLHTWIPGRLRVADSGLSGELFWFTEGFTDYYAHALLAIAKLKSFEWLVETINDKLTRYAGNAARNWPNVEAGGKYHKDRDAMAVAYLRGMFVALNWNAALREASGGARSLSDAMRSLRQGSEVLGHATIAEEMRRAGVPGAAADILRWIDRGETVELRDDALGPCAEKVTGVFRVRAGMSGESCLDWFR